jgi:hypothetical protein
LTEFLQHVVKCIAEWGKKSGDCNGDIECLQACSRDLRACLDTAFPDSRKIEFESDKINYILSSVFFLTNRISKASIGLAQLDKMANDVKDISHMSLEKQQNKEGYEKMKEYLDEIIAKYF